MTVKNLILLISIVGTCFSFSQTRQNIAYISDKNYFQSKGAVYVPTGSYKDSSGKIISVQAFFMTNEITNKEYRKFTDYVASHPDSSLYNIDLKKTVAHFNDTAKKTRRSFIQQVPFSELKNSLIDSLAMAKNYPPGTELYNKYKNYFTDKNYDDYPVVGVSWNAARYYCIWKTAQENETLKKEGKGFINDFRLPTKQEFEYTRSFSINSFNEYEAEINRSKSGKPDKTGVYNLFGNVAEWLSSGDVTQKVIITNKNGEKKNKGEAIQRNGSSGQIGFRMVSTFPGKAEK